MNLYAKLLERKDNPLRIGVIGAGKFAAMYLAQVPRTPGVHLVGIADLNPANAKANLERTGWTPAQYGAASLDAALKERRTHVGEDWRALVSHPAIDIVIEATGNPIAAVDHALEIGARIGRRQVRYGDEMHAGGPRHLREIHRGEFAGADHADPQRLALRFALLQQAMEIHVTRP